MCARNPGQSYPGCEFPVSKNSIVGTLHDETGYAIITVNIASGDGPDSRRLDGKKAVIDTAATNSAADGELITELGLDQMGVQDSRAFDREIPDVPYYAGRIEVPDEYLGDGMNSFSEPTGFPDFTTP